MAEATWPDANLVDLQLVLATLKTASVFGVGRSLFTAGAGAWCESTCVGVGRYIDAGRLVSVVLMVRAVMVLSIIGRMVRGFGGSEGGAVVVVETGVFSIMEMEATWCIVAAADESGKRGQNRAHT